MSKNCGSKRHIEKANLNVCVCVCIKRNMAIKFMHEIHANGVAKKTIHEPFLERHLNEYQRFVRFTPSLTNNHIACLPNDYTTRCLT